jgi:hypothetical protein
MNWLVEVDEPEFVVVDDENLEIYSKYFDVVKLFMAYKSLYSWDYVYFMRS